jgi:hypothetical protein
MLPKLHKQLKDQSHSDNQTNPYQGLIKNEAVIGGTIFGEVLEGCRRYFFCLNRHTWVWHEEWTDKAGDKQFRTVHYDINLSGAVKSQNGQSEQSLSLNEAYNLRDAINLYYKRVMAELYQQPV